MRNLIIIASSLFIVACGPGTESTTATDATPEARSAPLAQSAGPECAGTTNLLKNPEFAGSPDRLLIDWNSTQHGNIPSFIVSAEEGVVTVDRNGPEPWYNLEQFIDLKQYAGHRMLYQADLKLSLNSENWPHAFEPRGGLQVLIWGKTPTPVRVTRLLVNSSAEHSPNLGETDWFKAQTYFIVPDSPERSMIGLVHKANGSISAKNPALFDCGPAPESAQESAV